MLNAFQREKLQHIYGIIEGVSLCVEGSEDALTVVLDILEDFLVTDQENG